MFTSGRPVLVAVAVQSLLLSPELVVPRGHGERLRLGRLEAALRARHRLILLVSEIETMHVQRISIGTEQSKFSPSLTHLIRTKPFSERLRDSHVETQQF